MDSLVNSSEIDVNGFVLTNESILFTSLNDGGFSDTESNGIVSTTLENAFPNDTKNNI
tara:strand:- start:304 stop:477 length:174 start_codon:yes stop_codon:yes gene_type:complete